MLDVHYDSESEDEYPSEKSPECDFNKIFAPRVVGKKDELRLQAVTDAERALIATLRKKKIENGDKRVDKTDEWA